MSGRMFVAVVAAASAHWIHPHCTHYAFTGACSVCSDGWIPDSATGGCQQGAICYSSHTGPHRFPNCASCKPNDSSLSSTDTRLCTSCNWGFSVNIDGHCVRSAPSCDSQCTHCTSGSKCTVCQDGWIPNGGNGCEQGQICYSSWTGPQNYPNCASCKGQIGASDTKLCGTCNTGYTMDVTGQCVKTACDSHCTHCTSSGKCTVCQEGWIPNGGTGCQQGKICYSSWTGAHTYPNCASCKANDFSVSPTDTKLCTSCIADYDLVSGSCEDSVCSSGKGCVGRDWCTTKDGKPYCARCEVGYNRGLTGACEASVCSRENGCVGQEWCKMEDGKPYCARCEVGYNRDNGNHHGCVKDLLVLV